MSWTDVAPTGQAEDVRRAFLRAIWSAYEEESRRHAPDLGDGGTEFGQLTSKTGRHLVAVELERFDDLEVVVSGKRWWVEYLRADRRYRVFLYKAPPGSTSIDALNLDTAKGKRAFTSQNGRQLQLFAGGVADPAAEATNIVIAHAGDPETGLHWAWVGAPYFEHLENDRRLTRWVWDERFDDPNYREGVHRDERPLELTLPGGEFGLKLKPVEKLDESQEQG